MGWIYLAASAESQQPWRSGCVRSPIVRLTDTLRLSFFHAWRTGTCPPRPSGRTLKRSKVKCSHPSTLSRVDFPARTSALRELEKAWQASEAVYFSRSCGWPRKSSPRSYSLKMSRRSGRGASIPLAGNWPRQGMTVAGSLYPLNRWAPTTSGNAGFCWPTPTASESGSVNVAAAAGAVPNKQVRHPKTGNNVQITLNMAVRLWPTPLANDATGGTSPSREFRKAPGLAFAVQQGQDGGKLNPTWVEWLMGYPAGWTELKDWATQ